MRKLSLSLVGVVMVMAGCTGDREPLLDRTLRTDSLGVEIVTNPDLPAGVGLRLSDSTLVSLGGREAEGPYLLNQVGHGRLLPDGGFVVVDRQTMELRRFSAHGNHVWTVGGQGEGPGEFSYISKLFLRDSTLVVVDRRGIADFSLSGEFVQFTPIDWVGLSERAGPDLYPGIPIPTHASGFFASGESREQRPFPDGRWRPPRPFFWISSDLQVIDTLMIVGGIEQENMGSQSQPDFQMVAFGKRSLSDVAPERNTLAVVDSDRFEIHQFRSDGDRLRRIVRVDRAKLPVTRDLRADWEPRQGRDPIFADSLPSYARLSVDSQGRTWALVRGLELQDAYFHVFDEEGSLFATPRAPSPMRILDATDDKVLILRWDDLGVDYVEVYSLSPA